MRMGRLADDAAGLGNDGTDAALGGGGGHAKTKSKNGGAVAHNLFAKTGDKHLPGVRVGGGARTTTGRQEAGGERNNNGGGEGEGKTARGSARKFNMIRNAWEDS